jgi:F-type H+-transporting ATPase subunit gamma
MKLVAASKLRKAQEIILNLRPYSKRLSNILHHLATTDVKSPFLEVRPVEKALVVVVTSNRGLCGAFNNATCKLALQTIETKYAAQKNGVTILTLGRKGYEFFKRRSFQVIGENYDVFQNLNFEYISLIASLVLEGYLNRKWDEVTLVYNSFKNVAVQVRVTEQYLPINLAAIGVAHTDQSVKDYIFEPSQEMIISRLVPVILKTNFYKMVLDSNAAEHGARMFAMDKATDNADGLIKDLKLQYNKARQAAITKEILEIVGGAEALSSGR